MKTILSLALCFYSVFNLNAQIKIFKTTNPNVGFGLSSECATNEFMHFVVNGPLVDTTGIPVGGYIDDGVVIQGWAKPESGGGNFAVRNGIFGYGLDSSFHMVSYEERKQLPEMKWAIQNGPILVQDGRNICGTSTSKHARSGIGVMPEGTLVVIISLTPMTFHGFGELFVKEGCISAIYLDGGPYVGYADKNGQHGTLKPDAKKLQFFIN